MGSPRVRVWQDATPFLRAAARLVSTFDAVPRDRRIDLLARAERSALKLEELITNLLDLEVEEIVGDPVQLERVMANLPVNAIRHAPGEGPILIRTLSCGTEVEIIVADRRPGVPDELKQAVVEPFRQGDLNDAHSYGTGIGLPLVARFVARHGGGSCVVDRTGGAPHSTAGPLRNLPHHRPPRGGIPHGRN